MRESRDAKRARARKIIRALKKAYPDAKIALDFGNPLELLVATILSAQCTDERVNMVTPALFRTYRSAADYARVMNVPYFGLLLGTPTCSCGKPQRKSGNVHACLRDAGTPRRINGTLLRKHRACAGLPPHPIRSVEWRFCL